MKKIMLVIKKIVVALCMLYGLNILIGEVLFTIPMNFYTILLVSIFDIPGILLLLVLKKLIV